MYGMVNNALKEMVRERLGEEAWQDLCRRAGHEEAIFLSLETYPDEVTYALAGEAAAELKLSVPEFLEQFGRFWIDYALRSVYAPLLRASSSLEQTLSSLDGMHRTIARTLANLRAPSFSFEPTPEGGVLRYRSTRAGLAPFVVGLVQGLAAMHRIELQISQVAQRSPERAHDEFKLVFRR